MKTKCYSVRLSSLISISEKAYKATAFDGSTAIIPKSQVFGPDYEVVKSEAYWISAWILEKKNLMYSAKKERFFNHETGSIESITVHHYVPENIKPKENNFINLLKKKLC